MTAPAVADEIAGLAELAQGKLGSRPFAVVRGRADLVLAPDDDGPGAGALVRAEGGDLFGFGAREAVLRAVRGDQADRAPFGAPVSASELAEIFNGILDETIEAEVVSDLEVRCPPTVTSAATVLSIVAFAHGWQRVGDTDLRFRPAGP